MASDASIEAMNGLRDAVDNWTPNGGAKVISVIETNLSRRGRGAAPDSPIRIIKQYWSLDGVLLAEVDPWMGDKGKTKQ